jgi:hypothetical protein
MKTVSLYLLTLFLLPGKWSLAQNKPIIYHSPAYTIYNNSVVQGKFTAKAISATALVSNYQSTANKYISPLLNFKFSINGKDNEMASGKDHQFYCSAKGSIAQTPLIKFGQQHVESKKVEEGRYLQPATKLKVRLDMRDVQSAFNKQGYYTGANGDKIYKNDFKGVFIAGATAPMIWDFNNLVNHPELELKDPDGDGIYETVLSMNEPKDAKETASSWKLTKNISVFPQYKSPYVITDALYNLTLEEMQNAIEPDSTFRTGKEWSGVWTRDISYSIILSMAILQPKVAMYSLMRKVKDGRIIQDTGTGGAYPCSSDRMIWAVAAWEVYKVTGDKNWLDKAYQIIRKSAADDVLNVYDQETGMVRGESSFLDWREQTYPKWMQPADIYESECLGTNVVHYQVNQVLGAMAGLQHDGAAAKQYQQTAEKIKKGIQKYLWQADKGYYGQYWYGRTFKTLSPRSEALGEALSVLFGVAGNENQRTVISNTPVNAFGIPCIYPQIPGILPYHNNAVWPFVESYWALAAAKAGNETSVLKSMSAVYRPAALFLTNKENFVATDGDFAGTQINSSNMLWSLSGNLAMVYKVLFGMQYEQDRLIFKPFVPKALAGKRSLSNFRYRAALLNIEVVGYGNQIKTILLDGKPLEYAAVPAGLQGNHSVKITLNNNNTDGAINLQPDHKSSQTTVVQRFKSSVNWREIPGASGYRILKDGKLVQTTLNLSVQVDTSHFAEYQVVAVDRKGVASFSSEPVQISPGRLTLQVEAEDFVNKASLPFSGYSGRGFVNTSTAENTGLTLPVKINESGNYVVAFRYANGNGPINTENKCAIRTLKIDGQFIGTIVLPQRGRGEWSDWGMSNQVKLKLSKGAHKITLSLEDANTNMNGDTNQAMIDYVKISKMQ